MHIYSFELLIMSILCFNVDSLLIIDTNIIITASYSLEAYLTILCVAPFLSNIQPYA